MRLKVNNMGDRSGSRVIAKSGWSLVLAGAIATVACAQSPAGIASPPPPRPAGAASAPTVPTPIPRWPNKAALLEAARNGEFRGLPEIRVDQEKETEPLVYAVIYAMRVEDKVPPLITNGETRCRKSAAGEIRRLLTAITAMHLDTLGSQPPTFFNQVDTAQRMATINGERKRLGTGGGFCTTTAMGVERPHPYGAALAKIADDFSAATKEFVEAERQRRLTAYAEEQARIQAELRAKAEAKAKAEADARAVEQRRIDAERTRIEADQKRRQQQEKNRISG